MLACTRQEFNDHLPKVLKDAVSVVEITSWKPEKYIPLVRQICLYNDIVLDEDVEGVIEANSKRVKADWGPTKLRDMLRVLK